MRLQHKKKEGVAVTAHGAPDARKIAEWSAAFLLLDDRGKDSALDILRALRFAQSVLDAEAGVRPEPSLTSHTKRSTIETE